MGRPHASSEGDPVRTTANRPDAHGHLVPPAPPAPSARESTAAVTAVPDATPPAPPAVAPWALAALVAAVAVVAAWVIHRHRLRPEPPAPRDWRSYLLGSDDPRS